MRTILNLRRVLTVSSSVACSLGVFLVVSGTQAALAQDNTAQETRPAQAAAAPMTDEVIAALVSTLEKANPQLQSNLLDTLAEVINEHPELTPHFVRAAESDNSGMRESGVNGLAQLKEFSPEVLAVLVNRGVGISEGSSEIRNAILRRGEPVVPLLTEIVRSSADEDARQGAMFILRDMGSQGASAVPFLLEMVKSDDQELWVRVQSANAAMAITKAVERVNSETANKNDMMHKAVQQLISLNDGNADGMLSREEFDGSGRMAENLNFVAADANKDQVLTSDELLAYLQRMANLDRRR